MTEKEWSFDQWCNYTASIIGFYRNTNKIKWEDIEDIANLAMFYYFKDINNDKTPHLKNKIIDAIRVTLGRKGNKSSPYVSFTDLFISIYKSENIIDSKEYDDIHSGLAQTNDYDMMEAEDTIRVMAYECGSAKTGDLLRNMFYGNSSITEASSDSGFKNPSAAIADLCQFRKKVRVKYETKADMP